MTHRFLLLVKFRPYYVKAIEQPFLNINLIFDSMILIRIILISQVYNTISIDNFLQK